LRRRWYFGYNKNNTNKRQNGGTNVTITWLGHSCFLLESGGERLVLDPYRDVPGYPPLHVAAHRTFTSHEHFDHNHRRAVFPLPVRKEKFSVDTLATFHDEVCGAKRGDNTVHILSAEAMRVVHLGDLGHMLTEEQIGRIKGCDVLMVPVGGVYTVDAATVAELCRRIRPRIILPMHYYDEEHGLPELEGVEPFRRQIGGEYPMTHTTTCTVEITAQTPRSVILLTYPV
jgi:L-ascorbate metabolism protein UlaG (beta-lactamase superfamily)